MPDDQLDQVAEQALEETPDEKDELDAFSSDDDGVETGLEKKEEPAKEADESDPAKQVAEEGAVGEDGQPAGQEGGEVVGAPEDEDVKRGQEILEQQRKAEEERQAAEANKETPGADEPYDIMAESFTDKDVIEKFVPSIPPNLFPKKPVELEDGTQLDFQAAIKDYPEMPVMIQMLVNNQIRQMMGTGFLVGGQQYGKDKSGVVQSIEQRFFRHTVLHPQYGVPEAQEIIKSEEFGKWIEKQPDAIKALRTTGNPWDYIRVLKRYQNKEVLGKAKEEVATKDEKRKEKKKVVDSAFKAEKSKGTPKTVKAGLGSKDDEAEAFFSDDDDEMY